MRHIRSLVSALAELFGDRLVPALLTGAGVFLVAAGLLTYLSPAAGAPAASVSASLSIVPPASFATVPPPSTESASPSGGHGGVATRVVIPALNVDLPVVSPPTNEEFPLCGVAEYYTATQTDAKGASSPRPFAYPGAPQATYLYAHARTGMFLPLLTASRKNAGQAMIGLYVEVYTADDVRHVYEISQVLPRRPATGETLAAPLAATSDQLWLQTSEGPNETSTKLQVVASPIGVLPATTADAHPASKGQVCPDAPRCQTASGGGCRRA